MNNGRRTRPRRALESSTPLFMNPKHLRMSHSEGALMGLKMEYGRNWTEGIYESCCKDIVKSPALDIEEKDIRNIFVVSEEPRLEIRFELEYGNSTKVFYLRPRQGISNICLCKAGASPSKVKFSVSEDGYKLMLLKGTGHRLLMTIPRVYYKMIYQNAPRFKTPICRALLRDNVTVVDEYLRLYWVEPPTCQGHSQYLPLFFECRWCRSKIRCPC
jgi:hypothetical protein